jgi:hypothetical protein
VSQLQDPDVSLPPLKDPLRDSIKEQISSEKGAMSLSFHNFKTKISKLNKLIYHPDKPNGSDQEVIQDVSIANINLIQSASTSRQG